MGVTIALRREPSLERVAELKAGYAAEIAGPLEPYIEELIGYGGTAHTILGGGVPIGYCIVSANKVLLQFYVLPDNLLCAEEAFRQIVAQRIVDKALVITYDPLCLSLAMDLHKNVTVRCHLFADGGTEPSPVSRFDKTAFRMAELADIPVIRAACGDFHDFLHYTLEGSVAAGEIFVLYSGAELLGTGVISGKNSSPPWVDIGMCVSESHRMQGVGTHIVLKLREHCRERGWISGASCQSTNTASKKTLEKAGMVSRDRVLEVTF